MRLEIKIILLAATLVTTRGQADSFGSGANAFSIDFVTIGHAGNAADGSGYGAVANEYRIGMHEVTIDQFAKANAGSGNTLESVNKNPYAIGVNGAATITWMEAAKFANYLTSGSFSDGAYQFSSPSVLSSVNRAAAVTTYGTVYVLPTEDEWYKAAYLKSDGSAYTTYAIGSSAPGVETDANYGGFGGAFDAPWDVGTGNAENNNTFDMNGNLWEWSESTYDGTLNDMDESRSLRGGAFSEDASFLATTYRGANNPWVGNSAIGFRVAAIPEPASILLIGMAGGGLFFFRKRVR